MIWRGEQGAVTLRGGIVRRQSPQLRKDMNKRAIRDRCFSSDVCRSKLRDGILKAFPSTDFDFEASGRGKTAGALGRTMPATRVREMAAGSKRDEVVAFGGA